MDTANPYASIADKVAIVTGGGSGIGKAAAVRLAQFGCKVCLMDLDEERMAVVQKEINTFQAEVFSIKADVSDYNQVKAGMEKLIDRWGQLDIVFANAGVNGVLAPIEDLSPDDWDYVLSTNLKSTFLTVKSSIPYLKNNGGSIIITSSINGNRIFSNFGMSAYSTSKAGQLAFGKMAALELARYRIRVNIICPGSIQTNIGESTRFASELAKIRIPVTFPEGNQPLAHGPGLPEQVAELVLFLSSDLSSHITGSELFIDGAESLL